MSVQPSLYNTTLKTRLQGLMAFRVVLAITFLGTFIWFQLKGVSPSQPSLYPLYALIIITLLLTVLYALIFRWVKNLKVFAYSQIFIDILLITAAIYVTGGMESLLSFLYIFSIISGGILLRRSGSFYTASASSIAYGVLMDMDFYGVIPAKYRVIFHGVSPYGREEFLTTVFVNIMAFYAVAFLIGHLAERLSRVEKRLVEKEIDFKRLEALNKYIVENINSGILTLDNGGRITSFNKGAERITGYLLPEVYYRRLDEVFPEVEGLLSNLEDGGIFREERVYKAKDGKELCLGFSISPGRSDEFGHIVIFQDLTRIKEMEEGLKRAERLRALGELAAGMAHEVRNPLGAISGSIQVLKEGLMVEGEERHLMDIALRETDRLNALITDFLLFARPAVKMVEVDMKALLVETIGLFENSLDARGLTITSQLEDGLIIEGDPKQLEQAFRNLFLNAAQAMPRGGELRIKARGQGVKGSRGQGVNPRTLEPSNPNFVVITTSDTGEGIRPEDIKHIFDPFFTTRGGGIGLGLAIAHRIIEGHGGTITVRSKRGRGTTFEINLPLVD